MTTDDERLADIHTAWIATGIITTPDVCYLLELAVACDCRLDALIQAVKQ